MQVVVVLHMEITLRKNFFQISAYVTYGYGCVIIKATLRRDIKSTQEKKLIAVISDKHFNGDPLLSFNFMCLVSTLLTPTQRASIRRLLFT